MNLRPTLSALAVAALATACAPFSLSPPARMLPLESSATLDEGQASVQASGGPHEAVRHTSGHGSVAVSYAPVDHLELQLEGSYIHVDYGDERGPHLGAARVGLKIAPVEHLSLALGVGAGSGAHGAFVSPDAALLAAYENPYLVPWGAFRGFASIPVDPTAVEVSYSDGTSTPQSLLLVPPNTAGWQISTGVRIPISIEGDAQRLDVLGGVGLTRLVALDGSEDGHTFFSAGLGLRYVFST